MDRGRGIRRSRGGRPFIRGFYRGRTRIRRPMGYRSRPSNSRDRYEYNNNDRSNSRERSWESSSGIDKDSSKEKHDGNDISPNSRNKWDKDEDTNEKNDERYSDKKDYYNNSKYYRRPTGYSYRGQRRPYQNNYWDRSDHGRHLSPQNQYRVRQYHSSPRHRRYSRSPDRHRSPSRYRSRSRSRSLSRSRRYSQSKHRSPKRWSPLQQPRSPNECNQLTEKNQTIKVISDDENNSDDFVEKLKASKDSKTPGRIEYSEKSDDDYWIESDKNDSKDTKKINQPDYSSKSSKTLGRSESSSKGSKTPGRSESSLKGSKTPSRQEILNKGSKTPGRQELTSTDNDDYWVKSQTSKPSTKNLYSNSWDDSPIREKSIPKVAKTPGRKDYLTQENDDYWVNSPSNESKKDHSSNDTYLKKTIYKDSTTMYVEELSSSDSEPEKTTNRPRSMSITNSNKSDTPPLNIDSSTKLETRYSQISSRGSNIILKEPLPPSIPAIPTNVPVYNSQWPNVQNASTSYSSTANYIQPQASQFTNYQQRQQVPVQNSQWYPPDYQQYGAAPFQQFQQYDQKSIAYNPVCSNLEPVEGYQTSNQGLYNVDLKQVVDISKPPPNITPITPVSDTQPKSSQDRIFEMQRESYVKRLFSLKNDLETLQIQYDTFKSDNTDGRHNAELKNNRKAQDDVNGKIKGINNILEVLNTMIPKDSLKEIKKVESTKLTAEPEYLKMSKEILQEEALTIHKQHRRSTSSSSIEFKKKPSKSVKPKKSSRVQSSDGETDSRKSFKSKELIDINKKKKRVKKLPQFNYVYCDSCIHWCQPCNIFPKTAKEYLTHLHSDSHRTTLEELNVVELPWHDSQTEPTQPEKNPELPTKRVPIKGLEFFIGTSAWYCKLCDTWIGDLHCASAHFKSKRHNDLYAELISKEPNWEIDWLTKRTRAFEKSLSQSSIIKSNVMKEDKPKDNVIESKTEKSFFEKEPRKDKEKEKLRDREKDKDRDRYKKELNRRTNLKNQLSPDKECNDGHIVSISDWMKPVDLPVDKSMITLKESVQKSKDKLHKNKTGDIDEYKSRLSNNYVLKNQKHEEPKPSSIVYQKKEENFNLSHRNKIKLPFIGKMPFAKPITKKSNSSTKDIPSFTVESSTNETKDNFMDSVAIQKLLIEKMITSVNDKKVEKQILPVDMDIDDDNENNEAILSTEANSVETHLNLVQSGNLVHQMYNQPLPSSSLPPDLNSALNIIFPCNEASTVPSINSSINPQVTNSSMHHLNIYDVTNNSSISPERKRKKNAPSQRKRRHLKKIMEKEDECLKDEDDDDDDDDDNDDDDNDDDDNDNDKLDVSVIQGPKDNRKSDGDELAMLGIDIEDMAAQYY